MGKKAGQQVYKRPSQQVNHNEGWEMRQAEAARRSFEFIPNAQLSPWAIALLLLVIYSPTIAAQANNQQNHVKKDNVPPNNANDFAANNSTVTSQTSHASTTVNSAVHQQNNHNIVNEALASATTHTHHKTTAAHDHKHRQHGNARKEKETTQNHHAHNQHYQFLSRDEFLKRCKGGFQVHMTSNKEFIPIDALSDPNNFMVERTEDCSVIFNAIKIFEKTNFEFAKLLDQLLRANPNIIIEVNRSSDPATFNLLRNSIDIGLQSVNDAKFSGYLSQSIWTMHQFFVNQKFGKVDLSTKSGAELYRYCIPYYDPIYSVQQKNRVQLVAAIFSDLQKLYNLSPYSPLYKSILKLINPNTNVYEKKNSFDRDSEDAKYLLELQRSRQLPFVLAMTYGPEKIEINVEVQKVEIDPQDPKKIIMHITTASKTANPLQIYANNFMFNLIETSAEPLIAGDQKSHDAVRLMDARVAIEDPKLRDIIFTTWRSYHEKRGALTPNSHQSAPSAKSTLFSDERASGDNDKKPSDSRDKTFRHSLRK